MDTIFYRCLKDDKKTVIYSLILLLILLPFCSISRAGDSSSRYNYSNGSNGSNGFNGFSSNNKYPSHFRILIWPYKTDVLKDYDLYRRLGLGGFQIDRGAGQYRRINLSVENKFPFYAGHVADKGYLYLTGRNRRLVTGSNSLLKRPLSLADPDVIKEIKAHIRKNIPDLKKGKVIAYALDDEISLGTFVNPSDVDISHFSLEWFRKWLQRRQYKTIEALNRQWGRNFKSFSSVVPLGFEQVRKGLSHRHFSNWNLSDWMDFRHFMDFQFSHVLSELVKYSNTLDPDTPAGFVGGQGPSVWGGYDYGMLSRAVQWMEAYDVNGTNEILRSFWKNPKKIRMQTFFSSGNLKKDSFFLWYYMLHGNQAVIAWPEKWFKIINGKKQPTKYIQSLKKTFETVQGKASEYIVDKNSLFYADPIGIYYSHPSIQAGWAMDAIVHGKTWPKRFSSIDNKNQSAGVLRKLWCKTLEDLGYQYDFINYLDVRQKKIDLNRQFKLIILPKTVCLSQTEANAMKRFVANGGVLVADYLCGIFDDHGRWRKKGILDDLFNIKRNDEAGYLNGKGVTEINAERYNKAFNDRFSYYHGAYHYKNIVIFERGTKNKNNKLTNKGNKINNWSRRNNWSKRNNWLGRIEKNDWNERSNLNKMDKRKLPDVLIRHNFQKGFTVYLNLSPIKYWNSQTRLSEYGKNWRRIISRILDSAGLKPRVRVHVKDSSAMVESLFWKNGKNIYLGIIANPSNNFEAIKNGKATMITLLFNKMVHLRNLRTQIQFQRKKIFQDKFLPWEGNVYQVTF